MRDELGEIDYEVCPPDKKAQAKLSRDLQEDIAEFNKKYGGEMLK